VPEGGDYISGLILVTNLVQFFSLPNARSDHLLIESNDRYKHFLAQNQFAVEVPFPSPETPWAFTHWIPAMCFRVPLSFHYMLFLTFWVFLVATSIPIRKQDQTNSCLPHCKRPFRRLRRLSIWTTDNRIECFWKVADQLADLLVSEKPR
jgi:hypothetical protein